MASLTPWQRLRQLAAINAGRWEVRETEVWRKAESEEFGDEKICHCASRDAARYIVAVHQWLLPLMNGLVMTRKKLRDLDGTRPG